MPCAILGRSPRRAGAQSQLLLAETVTFDSEERDLGRYGSPYRELVACARGGSSARSSSGYRTELIQHNGTWQLGVDLGELEPLLVQLFQTLGEWLEDSRVDSLLLHFDDRQYTLLRPAKDRHRTRPPPSSSGSPSSRPRSSRGS